MSEDSNDTTKGRFDFAASYQQLKADFPTEAYSTDNSRGFALTSLKAQYMIERLNDVFGIDGWRFQAAPGTDTGYEAVEGGILFHGQLLIDNGEKAITQFSPGYSATKKNVGDVYKSAKTDSLSKCASLFGLGNDMYKGKVNPPSAGKSAAGFKSSTGKAF